MRKERPIWAFIDRLGAPVRAERKRKTLEDFARIASKNTEDGLAAINEELIGYTDDFQAIADHMIADMAERKSRVADTRIQLTSELAVHFSLPEIEASEGFKEFLQTSRAYDPRIVVAIQEETRSPDGKSLPHPNRFIKISFDPQAPMPEQSE